jgi:ribonucleoside-triphosphate reductase
MGNQWYNEPKTLDAVFDVISDITFCGSSQQYGGFTLPNVEKVLRPYAEKSFKIYVDKYTERFAKYGVPQDKIEEAALEDVENDFEQGFQGWECRFNTVSSSRGDYPFITTTFGNGTSLFEKMAIKAILKVRQGGQGKEGFKKPVLFPKLVFLYDENLHGAGKEHEDLFDAAIECISKTMYPHMLSLTGDDTLLSAMYKKYGKVVSPMGCRAFLAPWYERGGMEPADENDQPVFTGRFNLGAISLNLPMILAKSREDKVDFYTTLDEYLELIRGLHKRTYDYIGEMRASTNPLGFCEGGFYGGNLKPDEKIRPLLRPMTMSFGITALNELQELYNSTSLVQDGKFAIEVMEYINKKLDEYKKEDNILYAIYGTPAESLCGTQVQQFRAKYGVVEKVSDKDYFSNSFHCHVGEDITPIQKQDFEKRFWNLHKGGRVQFFRFSKKYNKKAIKDIIRRGMVMGFYEGAVCPLAYCEDCGAESDSETECTHCGSTNLTVLDIVCGYLGYRKIKGDTRFNAAKLAEVHDRKCM